MLFCFYYLRSLWSATTQKSSRNKHASAKCDEILSFALCAEYTGCICCLLVSNFAAVCYLWINWNVTVFVFKKCLFYLMALKCRGSFAGNYDIPERSCKVLFFKLKSFNWWRTEKIVYTEVLLRATGMVVNFTVCKE